MFRIINFHGSIMAFGGGREGGTVLGVVPTHDGREGEGNLPVFHVIILSVWRNDIKRAGDKLEDGSLATDRPTDRPNESGGRAGGHVACL